MLPPAPRRFRENNLSALFSFPVKSFPAPATFPWHFLHPVLLFLTHGPRALPDNMGTTHSARLINFKRPVLAGWVVTVNVCESRALFSVKRMVWTFLLYFEYFDMYSFSCLSFFLVLEGVRHCIRIVIFWFSELLFWSGGGRPDE